MRILVPQLQYQAAHDYDDMTRHRREKIVSTQSHPTVKTDLHLQLFVNMFHLRQADHVPGNTKPGQARFGHQGSFKIC
jgi:hypothetical protein